MATRVGDPAGSRWTTPEATDRILQVLFDVQTVGLHAEAIEHFGRLLQLDIDIRRRREILYWTADSYRGLEQYEQATLLYLQSAMLPGPAGCRGDAAGVGTWRVPRDL